MKNNKNSPTDSIFHQQKPWNENENSIWLASTVSMFRNIEKFKFPLKLEPDRGKQVISLMSKELLSNKQLVNPKLIRAEDTTPLQKEFLVEHFLSQESFHQAQAGEAFIIEDTGTYLITLNVRDHLHMYHIDCKGELENTWNRLVNIESELGKQISYAFSSKYGFLTSDFNLCGTGLNVTVFLQVPGLVHAGKIDEVLDKLADETIAITGIQGNPTEIIGDVIVAQNNYTLGVTEENIISNLRAFTTKMMVAENSMRRKIVSEDIVDIKDKVSRAYGILIHSYQIEAVEALNALSLVKLGLELKWMKGMNLKELNQLFFQCRRAHLLKNNEALKPEEILHKRAEFIHASLKNLALTI